MKITDLQTTTVSVPLEAPLRHANGVHPGRFVRTIVKVITDEGLVGLGEVGGGGNSAAGAIAALKSALVGEDPYNIERLRWKVSNPVQALYVPLTQMGSTIEYACLDIQGKAAGRPVCDIVGGRVRDRVDFAAYLFYRYENDGRGGEETPEQMVAHAKDLVKRCGFKTLKLKGGHFAPAHDVAVYRALHEAFPAAKLRIDPNSIWSVEDAIGVAKQIEPLGCEYLEDPCWGLSGMRRVKSATWIPTATNTVVVNFDQIPPCVEMRAVDIILVDPHFWGGILAAKKCAAICDTFQLGLSMHSGGELGISLAAMLHFAASTVNLSFAADAHYHHLTDDIIKGGPFKYRDGAIDVPKGPGLGVELDEDKIAKYEEMFKKLGPYDYHADPGRPGWVSMFPGWEYAIPGRSDRKPRTRP
jgi:glucarate dehydratase